MRLEEARKLFQGSPEPKVSKKPKVMGKAALAGYGDDRDLRRTDGTAILGAPGSIRINFGKYKGKTVGEVVVGDPRYLRWVLAQEEKGDTSFSPAILAAIRAALEAGT